MKIRNLILVLSLVAFAGCKESEGPEDDDGVDAALDEQIRLCEEVCLKPFCEPTLEPTPGVEEECSTRCASTVAEAQQQLCLGEYEGLLECLKPLACDAFYLWLQSEAEAPCVADEERLTNQCPKVKIRNEGG